MYCVVECVRFMLIWFVGVSGEVWVLSIDLLWLWFDVGFLCCFGCGAVC